MYENEVNASQFNTFDTNVATSNINRLEQVQNLAGNMKLRGGLIIADTAQRLIKSSTTGVGAKSGAVDFNRKQLEATKKLQEQSLKSFGEIEKARKKAFDPFEKKIPKSFDEFAKSAQKAFEPTNTIIGNTRKLVAGLENGLEKLATATFVTKTIEILVNGFSRIKDEINQVSSSMKVLNKSGFDPALLKSLNDFEDSLTSLDFSNTEEFATSFVAQYTQITEGLAQVGTLIPNELKKAANEGRNALSDLFDDVQDMVNGTLKNTVSSSEAIAATYTALQAGIGGDDDDMIVVNDAVENTLKLIAAQGGDANQVMELLVQTMTAFNMSANSSGEILGKLNELVNVGITTIPELSNGFGQLGVSASAAGLDLDELTVGMAALTLSGSNTFSAMTSLQNLFNKISSGTVTERLSEMGVTLNGNAVRFDAASVSAKGFLESVEELNRALGGDQQKIQIAFGGDQEAVRGIRGLLKTTEDDLAKITSKIANAGVKNLEEAFNIKIDNDKILQFEQVLNRVSEIALKLGKILTPLFSKGLDRIEKNIDRISYLANNYGNLIIKLVEFNLAMKAMMGVMGALIGTIGKIAGAYAVWLLASGKLLQNGMKVWKMLTNQNAVLNQNNVLWNKNTSLFNKVIAVFGQLLGFYDLESAGQTKLTKEQEKKIAVEAKQRAIQASAHKQTMAQLQAEQEMYEKVNKIRQGKGENRAQNIFNEQTILGQDRERLVKQQESLRDDLGVIAPKKLELDDERKYLQREISRTDITEDERKERVRELTRIEKEIQQTEVERNEKIKQLKTTQKQIKETDEITTLNETKIKRFEKLREVDSSGRSQVDIMRDSVRDLENRKPETLTKEEKLYLKTTRKELAQFDDIELARRAKDYNQEDEQRYRENVATRKYIDENQDKPAFKRAVENRQKKDGVYKSTRDERLIDYYEGYNEQGLTRKQDAELNAKESRRKMRMFEKDSEEYRREEKKLQRIERIKSSYTEAKRTAPIRGTNLSDGKLGQNDFTVGIASFIDSVTGLPGVFKEIGLKTGEFTKNLKKNIIDGVSALGNFSKSILTFRNVSVGVIGSLVALTGALFIEGEKNAQKARDLLAQAGLEKNDPDIVSPLDALKKQLTDIGKWITDFIGVTFKQFKQGFGIISDFLIQRILAYPKSILQNFNFLKNAWANLFNFIIDKIQRIPGLGFLEGFKIDTDQMKKDQDAQLKALDDFGKNLNKKITQPLDDAGNAFTRFVKDVTYAVTEANEDIARAKIYDRIDQNNLEIKQLSKQLGNLNTLDKGGRFADVTLVTGIDKKTGEEIKETFNLSNVLKEVITTSKLDNDKVNLFNEVASQTQSDLKTTYDKFERTVKENEKADQALRTDLVENIKLVPGQEKNVLESVIQARTEVEVRRLRGDKDAKLDLNGLTEKERTLNASLNDTQRNEIDRYTREAAKTAINTNNANEFNKNLNDLSKVITAVQTFVKNRSDIAGSNNPDATRAIRAFDNTTNLLGENVNKFAKSLSTLSESQYSQEELLRLAKEAPEEYKKIIENSGADFAGSANIFSEIQKQIPTIIEQLQANAELGYISPEDKARGLTADTSKAQRFQEILDNQITKQFEEQGFTKEQAENYKNTLLADQKIREQIFALEADDYEKRKQRLEQQKQVFEVVKQSELLVTKDVIKESQKLEEKSLQESITFAQKRVQTLKQGSDNLDPQIIKDAETEVKVLEEKLIVQRINQKRELLDYESNVIKNTYEKRYAEIEELVLKGERTFSTDERIKFEAEKQQQIIALNVQTQMQLRDLLEKEGKLTKETRLRIEKDIQEQRVNLLRSYIEEAKQRYDNLAQNIQKVGDAEANYLNANINKLGVKTEIYDKINQLISQQKSLFDSAQNNLERDASYIRNNLVSRRKQIEFEKLYYAQRKKALAEQLAFERQSLEVQKKQNELLIQNLKLKQQNEERLAKKDYQIALINEEQVRSDTSSSEADKQVAALEVDKARINYETTILNRENVTLQEATMRNEMRFKEFEINQKQYQGFQDIARDEADYTRTRTDNATLLNQAMYDWQNGNYPRMPELIVPTIDTEKREQQARIEVEKVKEDTRAKTQPIRDDLKNKQEKVDENLTKLTEAGNITLSDMLNELRVLNGKQPINKSVERETTYKETTTEKDAVNKVFQRTIKAMLEMTGKQVSEDKIPQLRFADTGNAGGFYYDDTNILEMNKEYMNDIAKGEGDGFSVLVHELRHWMQDEGLTNGMLNTNQITDPNERKWAKEVGLKFSGENAREEDAYAFQTNYDEMLQRIVNNNQVLKGAQIKENVNMSINDILQKQLKIQETILSFVKNFYGKNNSQQTPTQNNKENSPVENKPTKRLPEVSEKVDIVSVNKEGKQVGKTSNVRVISKERANEIKAQKELGEKIRRDNNEYYQTLAQLAGVVDTRPDAKPQEQVKQLKKFVESQVKQAYKMHTEGKLGAEQTQQFIKDWRTNEKEYAQILQRGVKNPNQEITKLKKQQEEQRVSREKQVEKTSGIKDVQQPLKSIQKQIEKKKEVVTQTIQPVTQKEDAENIKFDKSQMIPVQQQPVIIPKGQSIGGGWSTDGKGGYITPTGKSMRVYTPQVSQKTLKQLEQNPLNAKFLQGLTTEKNINPPTFKYQGQQGQILAGLTANTQNANKLNNPQNTNNNTNTQNKIVNVTLSPKIEVNIDKTKDEKLAKETADQINKQLFNIFNEVAYNI